MKNLPANVSRSLLQRMEVRIFFAVLAAGAILFGVYLAWLRIDRWNQGLAFVTSGLYGELQLAARYASTSPESARAYRDAINTQDRDVKKAAESAIALLDNKPFGIPLTPEQRKLRSDCAEIRDNGL